MAATARELIELFHENFVSATEIREATGKSQQLVYSMGIRYRWLEVARGIYLRHWPEENSPAQVIERFKKKVVE